jgi:hypothetical protein
MLYVAFLELYKAFYCLLIGTKLLKLFTDKRHKEKLSLIAYSA